MKVLIIGGVGILTDSILDKLHKEWSFEKGIKATVEWYMENLS